MGQSEASPTGTRSVSRTLCTIGVVIVTCLHAHLVVSLVIRQSFTVQGVRYYTLGDDAMISMRYAHNLVAGQGLVWNPGERVEGITNLGWTLLMAGVHTLGRPLPQNGLYLQLVNLCLQVALIAYVGIALRRESGPLSALLGATLVAGNASLICWGVWGFETSLQALLCSMALVPMTLSQDASRPARRFPLSMSYLGLAFIVRPDSLALIALWIGIGSFWVHRRVMRVRSFIWGCGMAGASVAAVLAFQRLYYGDWLPNTYHLKTTGGAAHYDRGLDYLIAFGLRETFQIPLLAAALLLPWSRLRRGEPPATALPLAVTVVGWSAYVVKVGGDAFPMGRFMVALIPLMAAATAQFIVRELTRPHDTDVRPDGVKFGAAAACLVGALLIPYLNGLSTLPATGQPSLPGVEGVRLAIALSDAGLPRDTLIAVHFAGTMPYFMPNHRFHDVLGKSDRHIALSPARRGPPGHNKWDFSYSLDTLQPDLVVTAAPYADATDAEMARRVAAGEDYGFHAALWMHSFFRERYRGYRLKPRVDGVRVNQVLWVYARADRAETLGARLEASRKSRPRTSAALGAATRPTDTKVSVPR